MDPQSDDYWSEDPNFDVTSWKHEVRDDNTRLGYWEWVDVQRETARTDV